MTDTDSELMRRQQDKDTPQRIETDETRPRPERHDSDPASAAAREAARAGKGNASGHAEDAVFEENRRSDYSAENEVFEDGRTDARPNAVRPPLAGKDRSLLSD